MERPYLVLDAAGVVDNADTRGVESDVQPLNDFCEEDLHLLKLWRANAPTAVDDEHNVCGASFAQAHRYMRRERKNIVMYSEPECRNQNYIYTSIKLSTSLGE